MVIFDRKSIDLPKIAIYAKIYDVSKRYEFYINNWFTLVKHFLSPKPRFKC